MLIKISQLSKNIGKNQVLCDVNLTMEACHVYGFWGINGSGKTMLMRAVAGLIRPSSGKITIDGQELGRELSFPKDMGLFLERPAFLDNYTGLENLRLLAQIKGKVEDGPLVQTMEALGLDSSCGKKYRKYSLGMKQKLGIASAIMERAQLIILDEPTNSLDESSVELLKKVIKELKSQGCLLMVSSHDREFLCDISDEIYSVTAGRVEVKGHEKL